jgi:quercetin dioxygenase-like cupin family protein
MCGPKQLNKYENMSNNKENSQPEHGIIQTTIIDNSNHQVIHPSKKLEDIVDEASTTPAINIALVANMFVRQMVFKNVGHCEQGHEHSFDHLTLLASGKLLVEANDFATEFESPSMIYIKKDVQHKLTALQENTVAYCIHGLRDINKSDDILNPNMIPKGIEVKELVHQLIV